MNVSKHKNITGVILAGGKARRMGGNDKGLLKINGRPMIGFVIDSLEKQVGKILINANRNLERYEEFGYPVINDELKDFQGPLAGILVAMKNAKTEYICTCPCDGPLIADDLVFRLYRNITESNAEIAVVHDGKRIQPVYALMKSNLLDSLNEYLASGERKIDHWYMQHNVAEVDFSDKKECFMNVNRPEDQQAFTKLLSN